MAKNITLNAQKRTVTGRKVKQLRAQGIIPGNVYGAGVASQAISFSEQVFKDVFKDAGETHVVDLLIKGEKNSRPTLIYQVQTDPITRRLLHVDFRQVNLKEKINA
ncbi:MAG: 50S ribosomal protein L25, partial [Patescibacteria group bacterium]